MPCKMFWCGILGWFVATGSLMATPAELRGNWVGSFQMTGERESPIRIEILEDRAGFQGNFDAAFEGISRKPLQKLSMSGTKVHFELPLEKETWQFDGHINEESLQGSQKYGMRNGAFRLVRTRKLKPEELSRYFGIYQFGPNRTVYIRTWDELGENQLTYLDNEGNVGPLFASARGDFFAGAGLLIPLPERARIEFKEDGTMIWSDKTSGIRKGKKIATYKEENVRFQNGEFTLSGTLVTPSGGKVPYPAVVFVHGSGRVTRDFMGPLAYLFVQHGIAVLSYDKRGSGKSEGQWLSAGFPDLAQDARKAVEFLKTRDEINSKRIGVLGISQGGWIGPLVAAGNPDVAFLIMISAPAVSPLQQEISRVREELVLDGASDKSIAEQIEKLKTDIDSLREKNVQIELTDQMQKLEKDGKEELLSESGPSNPRFLLWYSGLMDHDPVPVLKKLRCPVLVIYGAIDRGVPPAENQPILEKVFKQTGLQYSIQVFPKGNHALLESSTGSMKEFPFLQRFVPGFLDVMVNWIHGKASTFSSQTTS